MKKVYAYYDVQAESNSFTESYKVHQIGRFETVEEAEMLVALLTKGEYPFADNFRVERRTVPDYNGDPESVDIHSI